MNPEDLAGPVLNALLELMGALGDFPENLAIARRRWTAFRRAVRELSETQPPGWAHEVLSRVHSSPEFRVFQEVATEHYHRTPAYRRWKREYQRQYMRNRRAQAKAAK